jgi:SOS-response transcriptional repressor LexA
MEKTADQKKVENRRARLREWFANRSFPEKEKSYISQLINGKASFGEKAARRLERDYGMGADYLDSDSPLTTSDEIYDPEPSPGPEIKGKVPLISSVRAGAFAEAKDPFQPGDALDWIETTYAVQEHTFALRVEGESMEPEFPEGTILIVEPGMEPCPGDYVIVKNGSNEATFKKLIKDGGQLYLKPLNPRFEIKRLDENFTIVGVVRETLRRFR